MIKTRNALIIGEHNDLTFALPTLFHRAGFNVDIITSNPLFKHSRFIRNYDLIADRSLIPSKAVEKNLDDYDFIVVSDDLNLKIILESDITLEQKLKLLPITDKQNLEHIYSKIGLSRVLSKGNVSTPEFEVVDSFDGAINAAEKLGYPVMVKIDRCGGGGCGVFECKNVLDFDLLNKEIFNSPLLIQKKIIGTELDLSALYRNGKLIHFSYSKIEKVVMNQFGPSSVRTYHQLGTLDKKIFLEMMQLGKVLGADGFATISCLHSDEDNKRYFIEADMRPNVWVEFSKFLGDDPAMRIINWCVARQTLTYPAINKKYPTQLLMPYFLRLSFSEILRNRYNVWKYIPRRDLRLILALVLSQRYVLPKPKITLKRIKRAPTNLIRIVVPQREVRLKIKSYFRLILRIGKREAA